MTLESSVLLLAVVGCFTPPQSNLPLAIMEFIDDNIVVPLTTFVKNSRQLVNKCTPADYAEFMHVGGMTVFGFLLLGFIGFFIKLIFIPIHNVIMSQ